MLLKVLGPVIFRYDAKSSGGPWRIAYDAKKLIVRWANAFPAHSDAVATDLRTAQRRGAEIRLAE
eukprot:1086797-Prymnesium_polylepis.1